MLANRLLLVFVMLLISLQGKKWNHLLSTWNLLASNWYSFWSLNFFGWMEKNWSKVLSNLCTNLLLCSLPMLYEHTHASTHTRKHTHTQAHTSPLSVSLHLSYIFKWENFEQKKWSQVKWKNTILFFFLKYVGVL